MSTKYDIVNTELNEIIVFFIHLLFEIFKDNNFNVKTNESIMEIPQA